MQRGALTNGISPLGFLPPPDRGDGAAKRTVAGTLYHSDLPSAYMLSLRVPSPEVLLRRRDAKSPEKPLSAPGLRPPRYKQAAVSLGGLLLLNICKDR